jgi:hypothetical protein
MWALFTFCWMVVCLIVLSFVGVPEAGRYVMMWILVLGIVMHFVDGFRNDV